MLTLSLLLGAAAGVNAILGGQVIGVKDADAEGKYICADDCAYKGAFLGQSGFYCPLGQVFRTVKPDGTDNSWVPYQCAGDKLPAGYTERPRREGEEPEQCSSTEIECTSNRGSGELKNPKIIEWSEIAEQLEKAKSQDEQSSPEKTSPKKPVNCAAEASIAFRKCQQEPNPSFDKCNKKGIEAAEKCRKQ
ncbi:hypothetical protein MY10362_009218 [Beauveria mimosiformis]